MTARLSSGDRGSAENMRLVRALLRLSQLYGSLHGFVDSRSRCFIRIPCEGVLDGLEQLAQWSHRYVQVCGCGAIEIPCTQWNARKLLVRKWFVKVGA